MARKDLTNEEVERMGRDNPGSAAEYLRLRREELAAEKQAEREKDDEARFERAFLDAGGTKAAAKKAYQDKRNGEALAAAMEAEEAAVQTTRRRISEAL